MYVRVRMDVTERTEWPGVSAVVNLPDNVDQADGAAVAEWLKANTECWQDDLAGVTGEVHTEGIDIKDLRVIE